MKNNLTIYLQGGIGNQLFQFSIGYILCKKNKLNLKFCLEGYENSKRKFELNNFNEIKKKKYLLIKKINFKIKLLRFLYRKYIILLDKINKKDKLFNTFNGQDKIFYPNQRISEISPFVFNPYIFKDNIKEDTTLIGYYQSEKYFVNYRHELLKFFKFTKDNSKSFKFYFNKIKNCNSVAVHFRGGDYLSKDLNHTYNILTNNYYQRSIDLIKKKTKNPNFFIFTDDVKSIKNLTFLEKNKCVLVDTRSAYRDLHLMSKCKHFIIANSSFSWWGAWLSSNRKKIVCAPNQWINANIFTYDIIPNNWKKIKL